MAVQELLVRLGLDSGSFSKKLQGINKEIKILDTTFEGISSEFKNFEQSEQGLAKKTEYLNEKIQFLEETVDLCKDHIKELAQETKEIEAKMNDFSSKLSIVNNELEKNVEELNLAKTQYKQVSSSIENLQGIEKVFEEANSSINKHNEIIAKSKQAYSSLDKGLEENKASMEKIRLENEKLDKEIIELCRTLQISEQQVLNLTKQYGKTQEKLEKLGRQYEIICRKYGENSDEAKKLKEEIDRYNATAERQSRLLNDLPSEISKLSQAYGENVVKLEKLETVNKNMTKTQEGLKAKIKESQAEIKKQETAFKEAQEQLKKYGVETESLEDSLKQVKILLAQEKSALKETAENVEFYTKRIEALNEEQIKLQQQLDKTKKNMARKSQEMQDAKEKMEGFITTTKKLNRELAETQIDKMFVNLNSKAEQLELLGSTLGTFGDSLIGIGSTLSASVTAPLVAFGTTASKTFISFEERMRSVNAVFGGSAEEMNAQFESLCESARKYGRDTEWTAEEVGEAYEYMATAGWSVEKSTNSMLSFLRLATIGMLDLGTTADIVTDTMTPFSESLEKIGAEVKATGKEFNDAEFMVDVFAQTANKTNTGVYLMGETFKYAGSVSAEAGNDFRDVATAVGMMANNGVKGSMAGTSLAQGITRLLAPTENATALMEEFGIEVARNSDGGMDLKGTILNLQKAFQSMSKETQVSNAKIIFGQTALKGWLPLVSATADEYNELSDAIYNSAGASELFMEEFSQSTAYKLDLMESAIDDFKLAIGDALAPAIGEVAGKIEDWANKLSVWVETMKETNPELLSFIGKAGMVAIAIPPILLGLGGVTKGFGGLFKGTSQTIKGFTNFVKHTKMVSEGIKIADGKVGLLAKSLGSLIGTFGGATVGIVAGATAFVVIATAVGKSEKAISFLIDEFGALGEVISGVCEFIAGTIELTFGRSIIWLKGLGKTAGAIFTGKIWQLDDIWSETWAELKNKTAEGWANIRMESTRGISSLGDLTQEGAKKIVDTYEATIKGLDGITLDTVGDVSKSFAKQFKDLDKEALTILRGTSDQMTLIFKGIKEGMSIEDAQEKFEKNLKNLVKSGDFNLRELEKEFLKAQQIMSTHLKDGATHVKNEGQKIVDELGKIGQLGSDAVYSNVAEIIEKMDTETFESLRKMGGHWSTMFEEVKDIGTTSTEELMKILKRKVGELKFDTPEGLEILQEEIKRAFEGTTSDVQTAIDGMTKSTGEAFATMVDTIKNNSQTGIDDVATIFAEGLSTLDAETILTLQNTSDHWYSILSGTVDENGVLIDNFAQQILWNLGWVSEQSPEKLEGFKTGLLQTLVDANIITQEQLDTFVGIVDEKTEDAKKESEGTGEEVSKNLNPIMASLYTERQLEVFNAIVKESSTNAKIDTEGTGEEISKNLNPLTASLYTERQLSLFDEAIKKGKTDAINNTFGTGDTITDNLTPKLASTKVKEELDAISGAYHEKTQSIAEASAKAGEEAQKKFDEKVSNIGKDIQIDSNIINVEELGVQFQNAGTLAIQNFVMGWSNNSSLITEAIDLALTTITSDLSSQFEIINLNIDGVVQKTSILNDNVVILKNNVSALDSVGFNQLVNSINLTINGLKNIITSSNEAKSVVNSLANTSVNNLNKGLSDTNSKMTEIGKNTKDTSSKVLILNGQSLAKVIGQIDKFKVSIDKATESTEKLIKKVQELIDKSFTKIHSSIEGITSRMVTATNNAINLKNKLYELNYLSFDSLINKLANLNYWLSSVRNSAKNTSYAIQEVRKPSLFSFEGMSMEARIGTDYLDNLYARTTFDISRYQTRGGYYTPNSMAGTGTQAREVQSQKEQLNILKEQNDLLRQLLLATTNIGGDLNVSVEVDGKQVARSTAKYMEVELNNISKRKNRLGGAF